ncbi:protein phosphatase 2C [Plasmodium gonderi]|uniref:Protein phosphatase 2C n=1 Tax=Plasmodium gonderi TaxID=77519 RepID=A0A1Y1JFS9_PLAGO|nr:protein phosphatase 2C [Plasmodium gonderi]GAW81356.1 protein phosphatase 2C [Plasmodium gonderi]
MNPEEESGEGEPQEASEVGKENSEVRVPQMISEEATHINAEETTQKDEERSAPKSIEKESNLDTRKENIYKNVKDYNNINDIISYIIKVGVWEMYTYEWLMNRKTFLYYNTYVENYFFYDKNNNLTPFNEKYFFLYVMTFDDTEFVASFFFKKSEKKKKKKIKLSSYTKTMQGRRKKQEDRYTVINDMTKYIDAYDYKTLFFYKRNPFYCFSIIDGHRGIKACEYCMTHIVKNIIYYFYNQDNVKEDEFKLNSSSVTKDNKVDITDNQNHAEKYATHKRDVHITNPSSTASNTASTTSSNTASTTSSNTASTTSSNTAPITSSNTAPITSSNTAATTASVTTSKCGVDKNNERSENNTCDDHKTTDLTSPHASTEGDKSETSEMSCEQGNEMEEGKGKDKRIIVKEQVPQKKKRKLDNSDLAESEDDDEIKHNEKCAPVNLSANSGDNGKEENDKNNRDVQNVDNGNTTEGNTIQNEQKKLVFLEDLTDQEIINCIKLAFLRTDEQFLKVSKFPNHGCTVVSLIIIKNKMFIANLGDCRAIGIVNVNNTLRPEVLSHDHKPNDPKEKERIKKMGGDVICMQNVFRVKANAKKTNLDQSSLLDRIPLKEEVYLAVSRAIGDKDFKENNVVSAMPDVICRELYNADNCDENSEKKNIEDNESYNKDELKKDYFKEDEPFFFSADEMNYLFVVLACDGVWDTLTNKDVAQIVQSYQHDPDKACSEIIKTAFAYGSQDNITAIVLKFY